MTSLRATLQPVLRSQLLGGLVLALGIILTWLAYQYQGRLLLVAVGLVGIAGFAVLLRFPILGVAVLGFISVSNLSEFAPHTTTPILLATLAGILMPKLLKGDPTVRIVPVVLWAFLWAAWNMLSAAWAVGYDQFMIYIFVRTLLIMLCVIWAIDTPRHFFFVVAAAGLGVVVSSSMSIHSLLILLTGGVNEAVSDPSKISSFRFAGIWDDPNMGAISDIPIVALNLAVLRSRSAPWWGRLIGGLAGLFGVIAVVLTQSRSAALGLLVVVVLMVLFDRRRWLFMLFGAAVIGATLLVVPLDFFGRMGKMFEGLQGDASIQERSHIAIGALQTAVDHFPLGIGWGNIRYYTPDYALFLDHALVGHNAYADLFAELGMVGLVIFLGAHVSVLSHTRVRRWRIDPGDTAQNVGIAGTTAVLSIMLMNLFNSYQTYPLFWFMLALVATRSWVFDQSAKRPVVPHPTET